jgi:hypothetical protein
MIYCMVWLLSHPPLPSARCVSLSQSSCVSPVELKLTGEGKVEGMGEEPKNTTARKRVALFKSFKALRFIPSWQIQLLPPTSSCLFRRAAEHTIGIISFRNDIN